MNIKSRGNLSMQVRSFTHRLSLLVNVFLPLSFFFISTPLVHAQFPVRAGQAERWTRISPNSSKHEVGVLNNDCTFTPIPEITSIDPITDQGYLELAPLDGRPIIYSLWYDTLKSINVVPSNWVKSKVTYPFSAFDWVIVGIAGVCDPDQPPAGLANLVPFRPAGWSDKIVTSTIQGDRLGSSDIYDDQPIFVSWAIINESKTTDITSVFPCTLFADGIPKGFWQFNGLKAGELISQKDYNMGRLEGGVHTITIKADSAGVVRESNTEDNTYVKTITVKFRNPPAVQSFSGLSAAYKDSLLRNFVLKNAALRLRIISGGGSGNLNMYVGQNYVPTPPNYLGNVLIQPGKFDYAVESTVAGKGTSRIIEISKAVPGTYSVLLYAPGDGLGNGFNDVSLTAQIFSVPQYPPSLSAIANLTIDQGRSASIPFTVSDSETPADSLIVTANSANPNLLPAGSLVIGGTSNNRTLTIQPPPNQSGTANVTVTVMDRGNFIGQDVKSSSRTFVLTVNPVPQPPVITTGTTFSDDFNRPDSNQVGNGWSNTSGNEGGNLLIAGGAVTCNRGRGAAGIFRPFPFGDSVIVSATVSEKNGGGGLPRQYGNLFSIKSDGSAWGGYGIRIYRADITYSNSRVELWDNHHSIGDPILSAFQFGVQIKIQLTFNPDGKIDGIISGDNQKFTFSFGPRIVQSSGQNFSWTTEFPDPDAPGFIFPKLDDVSLSSGPDATPVGPTIANVVLVQSSTTQSNPVLSLTVPTIAGQEYVLETSESLTASAWTAVQRIIGDGGVKAFLSDITERTVQFFRIVALRRNFLSFPLHEKTPYTARVVAIMDHDPTKAKVTAYNGESGSSEGKCYPSDDNCVIRGYKKADGKPFTLPLLTYDDEVSLSMKDYLFYDNHHGYDYAYDGIAGSSIYPAAAGILVVATTVTEKTENEMWRNEVATGKVPGGADTLQWKQYHSFYVLHPGGYSTWYLHASDFEPTVKEKLIENGWADVTTRMPIAYVGGFGADDRKHLHFAVRKDDDLVDPYGDGSPESILWEELPR